MAVLKVGGVEQRFSLEEFDRLAHKAGAVFGNHIFKSELEPLRDLLTRTTPPVLADDILSAIDRIALDKRIKYKAAIDYLVFHWPDLIPANGINSVADPRTGQVFRNTYVGTRGNDHLDLVYGLAIDRSLEPYSGVNARYCDRFNAAADIGNGAALRRQWRGTGELGVRRSTAHAAIAATAAVPGLKGGITQATRQAHVTGLMASRMNPLEALGMDVADLRKDMQKTPAQIQSANDLADRDLRISRHLVAHARMIKSIRRACKGGIAMVASSAGYRAVNAKVHFVLDGCGDLGALAMKKPRDDTRPYVAITTSELLFCYRYWCDPEYPLANVVNFYVNGDEVQAPWAADWQVQDYSGKPVISNQEAWLRYGLARSKRSVFQAFPRF